MNAESLPGCCSAVYLYNFFGPHTKESIIENLQKELSKEGRWGRRFRAHPYLPDFYVGIMMRDREKEQVFLDLGFSVTPLHSIHPTGGRKKGKETLVIISYHGDITKITGPIEEYKIK